MIGRIWKSLNSFQSKILLSFFAFCCILVVWIFFYFNISKVSQQVQTFTGGLAHIQARHFESNGHLQFFMLAGFHQPSFYTTGRQANIDVFISEEQSIVQTIRRVRHQRLANTMKVATEIDRLILLHTELLTNAKQLKQLYYLKGFKDHGTEGTMRRWAHRLEDSSALSRIDILTLRRHEKDYLLRGEQKDVRQFNILTDLLTQKFAPTSVTGEALQQYKFHFNELVKQTETLGIYNNSGVYRKVQSITSELDLLYNKINQKFSSEVVALDKRFKQIVIIVSVLLLLVAILLSILLSRILTSDIKELNRKVVNFIHSRFKDDSYGNLNKITSTITEIEVLNRSFVLLKSSLKNTLEELELSIKEEKKTSANLEATVFRLKEKMLEIERQKETISISEGKLLKIADVQSHQVRGPVATILGLMNIIKDENAFTAEYLSMLEEAVNLLDERIYEIVEHTHDKSAN